MEAALQSDVRLLGDLLEDILGAQEGSTLAALLEEILSVATRARTGSTDDAEVLRARLAALDTAQALPLGRAFAYFLSLTNMAEQHHRVRLRRERLRAEGAQDASVESLSRLLAQGISADELHTTLSEMQVELVLTAHPTQMMRRTLLQKHRRIAAALARRDSADLLPEERAETLAVLRREILALWNSDELRRQRPTPVDEARAGLVLFDQILWDSVPAYLRQLDHALATSHRPRLAALGGADALWLMDGRRPRRQPQRGRCRHRGGVPAGALGSRRALLPRGRGAAR